MRMNTAEVRKQLHKYIDVANDDDIAAVLSFVEDKSEPTYSFSEEELNEFYRRRELFIKSGSKGYTVEEAHGFIRNSNAAL